MRRRIRPSDNAGTTLVELIVAMALAGIIAVMVIGVVSPAAKTFIRLQNVQFSQMILDNIEDEVKAEILEAAESVKIYASSDSFAGSAGTGEGAMLEYLNEDGYVILLSADGCEETQIKAGGTVTGTADAVLAGRLLQRYYWQDSASGGSGPYGYTCMQNAVPVVRAVRSVFPEGYYMNTYLSLSFSYPSGVSNGDEVPYIKVTASLYSDEERKEENLLTTDSFVAELRYVATRTDAVTAAASASSSE